MGQRYEKSTGQYPCKPMHVQMHAFYASNNKGVVLLWWWHRGIIAGRWTGYERELRSGSLKSGPVVSR